MWYWRENRKEKEEIFILTAGWRVRASFVSSALYTARVLTRKTGKGALSLQDLLFTPLSALLHMSVFPSLNRCLPFSTVAPILTYSESAPINGWHVT